MATYIECDCCRAKLKRVNKWQFRSHIKHMSFGTVAGITYTDENDNPMSDQITEKDLCNKCYNEIMLAAFEKYRALQGNIR